MGGKETLRRRVTEATGQRIIARSGIDQVSEIPGIMEQQFFLYLTEKYKGQDIRVIYEPDTFKIFDNEGNTESTTPDYSIITSDGTHFYIEITTSLLNGRDPKRKQKRIMSHFPEVNYKVLYYADLRKIQEENPRFSFWHAKKII